MLAFAGAADVYAEEAQRFEIRAIRLEGNTLLSPDELDSLLKPFVGPDKDFGTLQEALDTLQDAYRAKGYSLAAPWLPEQTVGNSGEILIRVLEPRLAAVRVNGLSRYTEAEILRALPALRIGESPQVDSLSRNLRLANENPGRRIAVQFASPSAETDIEANVRVTEASPWKISVGADRTGDKATGEYRMHTSLQYANLFDRDHTASIQYTTSPGHADKVKTWVGAYRVPFYALGDSLDVFAAWSDIDSSDAVTQVSDVQLTGKGSIFGLRYTKNLPQLGLWTQKLVGGIDYRRYKNDIRLGPTPYKSDYAALPLSLTWGVSRSDERLTLDASAGIIRNLPWVGLSGQSDYDQG